MTLRIQRLSLTDFRAFPGPAPAVFELGGMNLLVHGENGSGKSSLFHALREFFSLKPQRPLGDYKNVFSSNPLQDCRVEVTFDDGSGPVVWDVSVPSGSIGSSVLGGSPLGGAPPPTERHPARLVGGDPRVVQTALRRACLDYRSLLDTNYGQGEGPINLFNLAVQHLIHDFSATVPGGTTATIGELWEQVQSARPPNHRKPFLDKVNQACVTFNQAFTQAMGALYPKLNELLTDLAGPHVEILSLSFSGVTYNPALAKRDRKFRGLELIPTVRFRTHKPPIPQQFMNEARLSALGLAIYLAGRLACTPPGSSDKLNLLVLDDVLIGLDHSNRMPVLDVLKKHFADWQIVLLTHDRGWYEMARMHLPKNEWRNVEVFEGDSRDQVPTPILRSTCSSVASAYLDYAESMLSMGYLSAAANYTRQAFEAALKEVCQARKVPVPYSTDSIHHNTGVLLDGLKSWAVSTKSIGDWGSLFDQITLYRKIVLNPYSHALAPNIPRSEIQGAIYVVRAFLSTASAPPVALDHLSFAKALIVLGPNEPNQIQDALCGLRVWAVEGLKEFCLRNQVLVTAPFNLKPIHPYRLWQQAKASPCLQTPAAVPHLAALGAEAQWIWGTPSTMSIRAFGIADLDRIVQALDPSGAGTMVLDGY